MSDLGFCDNGRNNVGILISAASVGGSSEKLIKLVITRTFPWTHAACVYLKLWEREFKDDSINL